jgi:hypothetical protein
MYVRRDCSRQSLDHAGGMINLGEGGEAGGFDALGGVLRNDEEGSLSLATHPWPLPCREGLSHMDFCHPGRVPGSRVLP